MPKVSEQHLEARREQILEGARRAFARHGYEGATVALLEEEIGLSRGAIFNYFPDKWALFFELAARDQHELTTLLMEQGLDATIRHLAEESPDWMSVYFEVLRRFRRNPELLEEFQRRGGEGREEQIQAWLKRLVADGAFRDDVKLEDIVLFVNVVANGVALARSLDLAIDADALIKLVHSGIDPKAGTPSGRRRKRSPQ
ncbi:MAG TPA: TetR/AcrR family transcriptional regulator [Gaiellaceae bacterium]|nr:TetR/AcrR family transcriptional regulator [Gaiellaceae bacterium]